MAVDFDPADTIDDLEQGISDDVKRAARVGLALLVGASPVRSGHFRKNWQVGVGVDPQNVVRERGRGSAGRVIAQGALRLRAKSINRRVFIVNNAVYAADLAQGSSAKAPAGWIDAAVAAMARELGGNREV